MNIKTNKLIMMVLWIVTGVFTINIMLSSFLIYPLPYYYSLPMLILLSTGTIFSSIGYLNKKIDLYKESVDIFVRLNIGKK